MNGSPEHVSPEFSLADFVIEHALRRGQRALPVIEAGQLVGLISVTDAKHIDRDDWATTRIGDVMTRTPLKTLSPDADLAAAPQLMVDNDIHQVPIIKGGVLVGMVTRADVMRIMQSRMSPPQPDAALRAPVTTA
jgi:CBS domain-containing protein